MSWINTLLDVGIMGMQANQAQKLKQLQHQRAESAAVQAIVQALRDEIFKFKQAAEEVLAMEESDPKAATLAMRILNMRLHEFGVTPDIFPELDDKEYAASTIKLIQGNSERLLTGFSVEQQSKIDQVADAVLNLPKYEYYIKNYDDVKKYDAAFSDYKKHKVLNSGCLSWFIGYWVLNIIGAIIAGIGMLIATIFSGGTGISDGAAVIGVLVSLLVFVGGIRLYIRKGMHRREFKEAKKIVDQFKDKLVLSEFAELEEQLGQDYQGVIENQKRDHALVNNFLDDKDKLQLLLG